MDYIFICKALAKALGSGVRLYQGRDLLFYTSLLELSPDPATPYIDEIICCKEATGIYTTPLFQLYAYLDTIDGQRIIVGPTCMPTDDVRQTQNLMFLLNIPEENKVEYLKKLRCSPSVPLERLVWLLGFLVATINEQKFTTENIFMNAIAQEHQCEVAKNSASNAIQNADDTDMARIVHGSYAYEKMLLSYVQNGQPEKLKEVLDSGMQITAGNMAKDVLRQVKNAGICGATVTSRAAIDGGLDSATAFGLSDLYIQKLEMLKDYSSIQRLNNDMFVDFAKRVQQAKFGINGNSSLFKECAQFVAANINTQLSSSVVAEALHISCPYLCTRFKSECGITILQYIHQEKVVEAKRLLQHTNKSLALIAMHLSFSSQSHFQNIFKKITGETPMEYRRKNL